MRRAAVGAILAAVLLGGCASSADGEAEASLHGTELGNPFAAPTNGLTDTAGSDYSLATDTTAPLTLVFFGYTNCPDICTMVMSNLASALTRLDDADRERVEVVFVTTDPARDDERTLRAYLDNFDPGFVGLTGTLPTIVDIAKQLGVLVERGERLPSGGYDVAHTDHVFVIDGGDEVPVIWNRDTSPADFAADLTLLLEDA